MADGFFSGGFAQGLNQGVRSGTAFNRNAIAGAGLELKERTNRAAVERQAKLDLQAERNKTIERVNAAIKSGGALIQQGGNPTAFVDAYVNSAAGRQDAKVMGVDPVALGKSMHDQMKGLGVTPQQAGAATGATEVAKAETIAGPLTEEGRNALAGVTPAVPNPENYLMPDGTRAGVDLNAPGARQKVQDILAKGGLKFTAGAQSATIDGLSADSKANINKYAESVTSSLNVVTEVANLRKQLQSADTFTALASGAVRGLSNIAGNMLQVARASGFDDSSLLDPKSYSLGGFGEVAAKSAAFRSNVISLAYSIARSDDPNGRLGTQDVQNALDQISAKSGDKNQILASLDQIERRTKSAAFNRRTVFNPVFGNKLPELPEGLRAAEDPKRTETKKAPAGPVRKTVMQNDVEFTVELDAAGKPIPGTAKRVGVGQ